MSTQKPTKKRKTFRSGLTKALGVILLLALGTSTFLIYMGVTKIMLFQSVKWDTRPEMYIYGYLPVGLGGILLIFIMLLLSQTFNQYIVITPQALAYQKGKWAFSENWEDLVYAPPKGKEGALFQFFLIGNKDRIVRIDSTFFPRFDTINEIIRVAKESRKTKLLGMDL
jgi:hypothetical protein